MSREISGWWLEHAISNSVLPHIDFFNGWTAYRPKINRLYRIMAINPNLQVSDPATTLFGTHVADTLQLAERIEKATFGSLPNFLNCIKTQTGESNAHIQNNIPLSAHRTTVYRNHVQTPVYS